MLKDKYGRTLNYLRLAVTDKCNLRCRYCMPEEGISFLPKEELLSFEEIARLCHILSSAGVSKIRITGGEPFARSGLADLLKDISPMFRSVNITSNATLIEKHLAAFQLPNIGSINVSLDSLNPLTFFAITKRDLFDRVWSNINHLYDRGLRLKINAVIMKGINDQEIPAFLDLAAEKSIDVRFIEAMPFNGHDENNGLLMPFDEILDTITKHEPFVKQVQSSPEKSASIKYEIPGYKGNIGIIPAFSRSLCGTCNRIRVTSQGEMMNCLYTQKGIDLRPSLRGGKSDNQILNDIQNYLMTKPKDGFAAEQISKGQEGFRSMTTIGG